MLLMVPERVCIWFIVRLKVAKSDCICPEKPVAIAVMHETIYTADPNL